VTKTCLMTPTTVMLLDTGGFWLSQLQQRDDVIIPTVLECYCSLGVTGLLSTVPVLSQLPSLKALLWRLVLLVPCCYLWSDTKSSTPTVILTDTLTLLLASFYLISACLDCHKGWPMMVYTCRWLSGCPSINNAIA